MVHIESKTLASAGFSASAGSNLKFALIPSDRATFDTNKQTNKQKFRARSIAMAPKIEPVVVARRGARRRSKRKQRARLAAARRQKLGYSSSEDDPQQVLNTAFDMGSDDMVDDNDMGDDQEEGEHR